MNKWRPTSDEIVPKAATRDGWNLPAHRNGLHGNELIAITKSAAFFTRFQLSITSRSAHSLSAVRYVSSASPLDKPKHKNVDNEMSNLFYTYHPTKCSHSQYLDHLHITACKSCNVHCSHNIKKEPLNSTYLHLWPTADILIWSTLYYNYHTFSATAVFVSSCATNLQFRDAPIRYWPIIGRPIIGT